MTNLQNSKLITGIVSEMNRWKTTTITSSEIEILEAKPGMASFVCAGKKFAVTLTATGKVQKGSSRNLEY